MDEQAKKINEAIGEARRTMDLYGYAHTRTRNALDDLLRRLPVEGWPEQLPTMSGDALASSLRGGDRVQWWDGKRWWPLLAGNTGGADGAGALRIVARVVEPPKPSTERVPWHEAVGRKINGRLVREVSVSDAYDPWCSFTEPGAGDDTDDDSTGLWADPDGMVEVEVLDTETGAPE